MVNRSPVLGKVVKGGVLALIAVAMTLAAVATQSPSAARAARPLTTLTFTELPFQPVDGLSVEGVTFGFQIASVASTDANYNSGGPGSTTYVHDPSLEGNAAGVLTLTFARPTNVLSFGLARSCMCSLQPGVSVELFAPSGKSLGVRNVDTEPLVSFSEGQFTYSGHMVRKVVISFPDAGAASRFALDNLTY